ncbi:MAG: hypothetical protein QXW78_02445 [Candidatus Thermoplasmatota archaeon]
MKIKNIVIKAIEARRFIKDFSQPINVRIDHNSNITLFSVIQKNEAQIEFEYVASYGGIGVIKFEGELLYESDDVEEIADRWRSKKNMPDEVASQIHTAIMHYCVPEAVAIAREIRLPPPIPLPQIRFDSKSKRASGPEVA